ncbi:restriction endonuclease subunit S [Pseudomonas aeruginosa]|jgi:type I restriction enzyme S subunit|nr:restriction endonuclease subunit S [Vibrio fluvialis]
MGGYKSYHEYKSTDLPWVPEIPAGWHVRKLTHAISYQVGFTPESGNAEYYGDDYLWANISDLGPKVLANTSKGITEEAIVKYKKRPAKKGSLLYSFKLSVGQVSFAGQDMFTNEAIASFGGSEHVDLSYFYFLAPIAIIQNASENIYGAKILNQEAIGAAKILVPPMEEQRKIAEFLDYKTAQVDALIAKKQSLLDKLAEQRTALISQAVTKGLDPSVPMKDSGVDWLGKIPKYWHVSKLGYVAKSLQTGPFGSQLHADEYVEDGTPLINPSDISKGKITGNPTITVEDAVVARLSRHKLELGDIVIARRGEMGRAGLVGKGNVGWLCGTGSLRARLKKEVINPEFLLYQFSMRGVSEYLSLQSVGSTMDNLNTSILGRLWVVVPPLQEQNDIISEIQKVSSRIEKMRSSVTSAISKLQEYRSALITNAVTGKIDVRDFCIPTTTEQREVAHG